MLAREYFALEPRGTRRVALHVGSIAPEPNERGQGHGARARVRGAGLPSVAPAPGAGDVQRAIGWTSIGVGATSLILTGVFIGLRAGALNRLMAACPALTRCPTSVSSIVSDGKTEATLVNVFSVIGGVAAASGVALLLAAPRPSRPGSAWIELRPAGLAVGGIFP